MTRNADRHAPDDPNGFPRLLARAAAEDRPPPFGLPGLDSYRVFKVEVLLVDEWVPVFSTRTLAHARRLAERVEGLGRWPAFEAEAVALDEETAELRVRRGPARLPVSADPEPVTLAVWIIDAPPPGHAFVMAKAAAGGLNAAWRDREWTHRLSG